MKKFASSSPRGFSRLDEDHDNNDHQDTKNKSLSSPSRSPNRKQKSPGSPSRRRSMLRSMGCITGSPKRIALEDDESSSHHHHDETTSSQRRHDGSFPVAKQQQNEETKDTVENNPENDLEDPPSVNRTQSSEPPHLDTKQHENSEDRSLRQLQLEEAIRSVIQGEFAETTNVLEKESPRLEVQREHDDEYMVFRPSNSDAGTDVSRGSAAETRIRQSAKRAKSRLAKPVIFDNDEEAKVETPEATRSSSVPTGDSYNNIEALIARVQQLDKVVQAGEEKDAARSATEQASPRAAVKGDAKKNDSSSETPGAKGSPRASTIHSPQLHDSPTRQRTRASAVKEPSSHSEAKGAPPANTIHSPPQDSPTRQRTRAAVKSDINEKETKGSPPANTIHSPPQDGATRQRTSDDKDNSKEAQTKKKQVDDNDGSQDFQVIYRRDARDASPVKRTSVATSSVNTSSVAASSIATMSSFGIPGVSNVQRSVPMVTPPVQKRRSANQLTVFPFFWRTHPKEIFTSYLPNRPKKMITPLGDGRKKSLNISRSHKRVTPHSSGKMRTRKVEVTEQKYDTRYRAPSYETFWSANTDPVSDSSLLQDGSPNFSPYGVELPPSPVSPTSTGRPSTSWEAFSEFSVGSVEPFG